jgi:hypothetical protein
MHDIRAMGGFSACPHHGKVTGLSVNFNNFNQERSRAETSPATVFSRRVIEVETMCRRAIAAAILLSPFALSCWGDQSELRVMSFNVWKAEDDASGRERIVETIRQSRADLVGLQEMSPDALRSVASALGYHYLDQRLDSEAILSRYRIVKTAPHRYGAQVELGPSRMAWLFNVHLHHVPYGPYQLNGITYHAGPLYDPAVPENIQKVVRDQSAGRGEELELVLGSATGSGALAGDAPVFLTGDFNEASHLDWTARAAAKRIHVAEVPWPTSLLIMSKGFKDSWRELYPDEVTHPGHTWSPVYPSNAVNHGDDPKSQRGPVLEPQDRIDMVYYAGQNLKPIKSQRSGPVGGNVIEELELENYPSDHTAVTTTFRLDISEQGR